MTLLHDPVFLRLAGAVVGFLALATIVARVLRLRIPRENQAIENLNARIDAWWVMCIVFTIALLTGGLGSYLLFGLMSLLALREFVTLADTGRGDHRALFWTFFVVTPLQYLLVALKAYDLFSIMIPVYAFLFVTLRVVLAGQTDRFLARTAQINWGLMVCVYCLSYAPALLGLDIPGFRGQGAKLLLFLVLVTQFSDVFQYICGKLFGRHRIAPAISPNKTWEGFVGGVAVAVLLGAGIWWVTPFQPAQAAVLALAAALMGFAGGLVMSAVKRDRGVKDFGSTIGGHGGMLDRIDSLTFAAPVFFQLTRHIAGV
jgi:phosphatidate cytidylyltransferase